MPSVTTNVFVRRTPAEVFDFLADARNLALWSSGVASVDSTPVVPGAQAVYRYRFPGRRRFCKLVCDAYEPGRRIAFRGQRMWTPLGTQVPLYAFDLLPHADGTLVRLSVTSSLTAGLVLLGPVVAMAWRRDLPADGLKFRELLGEPLAPAAGAPAGPVSGQPAAAPAPAVTAAPAVAPAVPSASPMRTAPAPHGFDYAH
jgi:uncharacterized protein YndB with AHSA1/START domain